MRRVNLPMAGQIKDPAARAAITEIERASAEVDVLDIASAYTITGTLTETRELNVTAPSTANIAAVLATLITDLKRGGQFRNT